MSSFKFIVVDGGERHRSVVRPTARLAMDTAEAAMQGHVPKIEIWHQDRLFCTYETIDEERFGLWVDEILVQTFDYVPDFHPRNRFTWGPDDLTIIRDGEVIYEAGSAARGVK